MLHRHPLSPLVSLALVGAALSCSSTQSRGTTPGGSTVQSPVRLFTDSDLVNDVAAVEAGTYVATNRGVVKYSPDGSSATRLGRHDGLPADEVIAVAVTDDNAAVWAATTAGVVRGDATGHFASVGEVQPDVGKPVALLTVEGGVLLGGERGLARYDGAHWVKLSDHYQVTCLARAEGGRVAVGTANAGVVLLANDLASLDEHGVSAGIVEPLVRDVLAAPGGHIWALVQSPGGMQLAHYDGSRWFAYTTGDVARNNWLGLVPSGDGVAILTPVGTFSVVAGRGEELTPTSAAAPGGAAHVELHPEVLLPPPPPPAPPAPEPPRRGRRPARGAAAHPAGAHPTTPAHPATTPTGPHPATTTTHPAATPATARPASPVRPTGDAGVARGDASVTADASASGDASAAPAASGDGGVSEAAATPAAPPAPPPVRPRELSPLSFPVDRPQGGPTLEAPTYGLVRLANDHVTDDVTRVDVVGRDAYFARIGLGVTRLVNRAGVTATEFRTHDLAFQHRALSVATDSRGNVWTVSEDGGPVRYNGRAFERVVLDEDVNVHPLMFWSRGRVAVAVARVGDSNVLRGYKLEGTSWRRVVEGPVETYGPGTVDVKFLAGDATGRFWVGLRILPPEGATEARELGVAVLDPNNPVATQYNSNIPATGGENGSLRAPNDVSSVEFDADNNAWFAGLDGATRIRTGHVDRFRESEGLRGDLVSDLARAIDTRIFFATPEGLGAYNNNAFAFPVEGSSAAPRATALAVDTAGYLWGAGPRGVWKYDGRAFTRLGRAEGLPGESYNDIAVDSQNRVWLTHETGIVLYDPTVHGTPTN